MAKRVNLLSVSDPRGEINLVARAVELAQKRDIRADGLFFIGNFCGPLLGGGDFTSLQSARLALRHELDGRPSFYRERNVASAWELSDYMIVNSERYRRTVELEAAKLFRRMLGTRDKFGKFVEYGLAAQNARAFYSRAVKLFSSSPNPCYVMADTCLVEELIPEAHWLHFAWISLGGASIGCLGATDLEEAGSIVEYTVGPRRGGRVIRLEDYPVGSADVVFAYEPSPVLEEMLLAARKKTAILCGQGEMRVDAAENVLATQRSGAAYLYSLHEGRVERKEFAYEGGDFTPIGKGGDGDREVASFPRREKSREELETKMKLAGVGKDLVLFLELMRKQDPQLAEKLELSTNRAEAIFSYVRHLEGAREQLRQLFSTERAGLERLLHKLTPYLGEGQRARLTESLVRRPDAGSTVEELDAANSAIAALVASALAERFGAPLPSKGSPGGSVSRLRI